LLFGEFFDSGSGFQFLDDSMLLGECCPFRGQTMFEIGEAQSADRVTVCQQVAFFGDVR
jgi:hypothetical protein